MQKIFELKNEDWSKGISAQGNIAVGGLFQVMQGIDPFYNQGIAVPSLTPDSFTPSATPKFLVNFNTGGAEYVYWIGDTSIKQVTRESPYTQTDKTSQLTYKDNRCYFMERETYLCKSKQRHEVKHLTNRKWYRCSD